MNNRHPDSKLLHDLARAVGIQTTYLDGLMQPRSASDETLVRIAAALGAPIRTADDAGEALRAVTAWHAGAWLPPVAVAWEGRLPSLALPADASEPRIVLEGSEVLPLGRELRHEDPLPFGYHLLAIERAGRTHHCPVIAAPVRTYAREGSSPGWGVATHLAALRSLRSRSVADLVDLELVADWVGARGGDLVTVLPLLPTFNTVPAEPSPYAPVSRLFWSELILDLGEAHVPAVLDGPLDVVRAHHEVTAALAGHPIPPEALHDAELRRYARFRGAQAVMGRNWRDWPSDAGGGTLLDEQVDPQVERFHLVAEIAARHQLGALRDRLDTGGLRLGLDLAVGVHPDGYDTWSRQSLFARAMAVGAPPDQGFPSGQDWGFPPVLPNASRVEGHAYLAASIRHQMRLAGVLRIDHVMAFSRLYWIPHGLGLDEGTYVSYPADELFAILSLESHRHRCEVVGENLGTVPREIFEALPRHGITGMYVAQFQAGGPAPEVMGPTAAEMAFVGTHDTPTFAGWIMGDDITDRVATGLLAPGRETEVREERAAAVARLAAHVGADPEDRAAFLSAVLAWLGRSDSPLVVAWLEDLWLEERAVNLPGTSSELRPNWQRPMARLLEELLADPDVTALADVLASARRLAR